MIDWQAIVAEHGSTVWRTVRRLLDQHADALDCCQETFLAAWRFAERQPVTDWTAFLTSLATRKAIDRLRQRYRSRSTLISIDCVPEPASVGDCPLQQARATELMERVRQGMAELADKQSEVFWLSCVEGQSHQQISDRIQVSPAEVRVLLHRARSRLREILDPNGLNERGKNERKPATQE
jgi:RNA polymerase sigma-70 factor (ECF subfamily)